MGCTKLKSTVIVLINPKRLSAVCLFMLLIGSLHSQCLDKSMQASNGAAIISANTGGFCLFCSVTNANNSINDLTTDFTTINIPAGIGGYGYLRVQLPETYPEGTRVGWIVDVNGGIGGLFNGVTLVALNNGTVVGTASGGSLFNVLGLGGGRNVNAVFCQPFNQIEIRAGSLVGILASYQVFYPYITEGCSFPVPCGTVTSTEICGDNIDNDGNGLVDEEDICVTLDMDGDGIIDTGLDTDINNPCLPLQLPTYTGYITSNIIWQSADCDNDGISNGQEILDITNPYDAADFYLGNSPSCLLSGIGMSKWYGDGDSQDIGDATNDDEDDDDFISFTNFTDSDIDISGWELYVDQNGIGAPVFTFPVNTILSTFEEVTIIADWNGGASLPANWFDANFASGEGFFEETSNNQAYAILRDPSINQYITIHQQGGVGQSLAAGTKICQIDFSSLIPSDFNGCEIIYWNSSTTTYQESTDCTITYHPLNDTDGDGISLGLDENNTEPCLPLMPPNYLDFDASNPIWQTADCDGDSVTNNQEIIDGTDPYNATDFIDADGDGVPDSSIDSDSLDPCVPIQNAGYSNYNSTNANWQLSDCDGDGVINGQELINGTNPYFSDCVTLPTKPTLSKN